jgi:two-component system cell cycle response regulator CtrA
MRLLLVEKARNSASALLHDQQHVMTCVEDADEAMSLLRYDSFDVVIVNLGANSPGGFELIRRMRAIRNDTPVLIVTGPLPADRAKALALGADDALSLPLDAVELEARLVSVLRRSRGFSQSMLQVGDLGLSMTAKQVHFRDTEVKLTPKEMAILEVMMLRRGSIVAKEALLTQLYGGDDEPDSKIIDVFVCKMRKKLEAAGAVGYIGTAWGRGYILRAPQSTTTREERQLTLDVRPEVEGPVALLH